jgi:hypothetical protein
MSIPEIRNKTRRPPADSRPTAALIRHGKDRRGEGRSVVIGLGISEEWALVEYWRKIRGSARDGFISLAVALLYIETTGSILENHSARLPRCQPMALRAAATVVVAMSLLVYKLLASIHPLRQAAVFDPPFSALILRF